MPLEHWSALKNLYLKAAVQIAASTRQEAAACRVAHKVQEVEAQKVVPLAPEAVVQIIRQAKIRIIILRPTQQIKIPRIREISLSYFGYKNFTARELLALWRY